LRERALVTRPLFFLGDGGYAHEVALIADLVDPDRERWDEHVFLGVTDEESGLAAGGSVVLALGTPAPRLRLWRHYRNRPDLTWPTLIHPRADIGPRVTVGTGACISSGSILTTNIVVGAAALVNIGVTVGHDADIGDGTVLNPGVAISGSVRIGQGCLIGTGAVVLQSLKIGAGATIGAGAVVTKDVAAGATVVGIPARPLPPRLSE
jgi:sugar O-acyltransferase (sialic acid O-acetyltransferase NeuD family)